MNIATFIFQYIIRNTTAIYLRNKPGCEGQFIALTRQSQIMKLTKRQQVREIITPVAGACVFDQPPVRMVCNSAHCLYIFIGNVMAAVAGLLRTPPMPAAIGMRS